ncbi:hypothetical protein BC829DRAFT_288533 [Chytridium lagenaria]|nr:hypothetical protein BC829DRAFT_288533 [Chytridium lagenaria]
MHSKMTPMAIVILIVIFAANVALAQQTSLLAQLPQCARSCVNNPADDYNMCAKMAANDPVFFACIQICPEEDRNAFWAVNQNVYAQCSSLPEQTATPSDATTSPDIPLWGNPIPTNGGWWGTGSTIPVAPATFATLDFGTLKARPTAGAVNAPVAASTQGLQRRDLRWGGCERGLDSSYFGCCGSVSLNTGDIFYALLLHTFMLTSFSSSKLFILLHSLVS